MGERAGSAILAAPRVHKLCTQPSFVGLIVALLALPAFPGTAVVADLALAGLPRQQQGRSRCQPMQSVRPVSPET